MPLRSRRLIPFGFAIRLFSFRCCARMDHRWYCPAVPKSPILPLAAAVTAVALGASPALAAPVSPGERNASRAVAFPLLAVKGQVPASVGYHVSHSSHVSSSGGGHVSHSSHVSGAGGGHVSHSSHVSSVSHSSHVSASPAPAPPVATASPTPSPSPSPSPSSSPAPAVSGNSGGSLTIAPQQGSLTASPVSTGSSSPAASNGKGCFIVIAPFGALTRRIRRLARSRRAR